MFQEIKSYFCTPDSLIDNTKTKEKYLSLFITAFLGMLVALLPCMIKNHGVFTYYGDFNCQQLMFYHHLHEIIRSGNFGWDWGTDLGTGVVSTWSFYLLGSPFFWLTIPFPNSMVVYLMPWLLFLKVALAAVFAYAYLRRFIQNKDAAFIGAMLYAFSGFQTYNVFFNHFHDVTAFFPLLLLAFEMLTKDNRKGVFALTVALSAVLNYFFFVGEVVFVIIYFVLRCLDKEFREYFTFKKLLLLVSESVLGFVISSIIILPSVLQVVNNERVVRTFIGLDFILYGDKARIPRIFQAFFTLSDMPARVNIFDVDSARWSSIAGYLPLFSMSGVIAYYLTRKQSGKRDWLCWGMIVFIVMACIPVLNSAFILFNSDYYARWFYMPILLFCLMTAKVLDEDPVLLKKGLPLTIVAGIGFLCVGSLPKFIDGKYTFFRLAVYPPFYHIQVAVTLIMIVLLSVLVFVFLHKSMKTKSNFNRITLIVTVLSCIICNSSEIYYGVSIGRDEFGKDFVNKSVHGKKNLAIKKLESKSNYQNVNSKFFRIDSQDDDNFCMFWGLSSMRCFHSTVTPSIINFYRAIDQKRDVASRIPGDAYPLRALFSVKYYFKRPQGDTHPQTFSDLLGFEYSATQNKFDIYENKNFIPMGFAFDYCTTDSVIKKANKQEKTHILMKALVLDTDQISYYDDVISKYDFQKSDYTYEAYKQNCDNRRAESCYSFAYNSYGFTGKIKLDKSKLVFFSVPYEKGWSAKVNGEPVKVEKVDYGFMAVCVPAGDSEIVFKYHADGQTAGIIFTIIGILLFAAYMLYFRFFYKKPVSAMSNATSSESEATNVETSDNVSAEVAVEEDSDNIVEEVHVSSSESIVEEKVSTDDVAEDTVQKEQTSQSEQTDSSN